VLQPLAPKRADSDDMNEEQVLAVVHEVLGASGDETILQYLAGVLADEHFEWVDAFDHVGGIMVSAYMHGDGSELVAVILGGAVQLQRRLSMVVLHCCIAASLLH